MGQLDTIWKQQRLSLQTNLHLYSSLVLSVLLYGSETWTLCKTDCTKVQAFHMMSQHRILGIKWYDHIQNSTIRREWGSWICPYWWLSSFSLFGHICRSPQEAPAHHALKLTIDIAGGAHPATNWKWPRGRSRRTWLQQLEEDLKQLASIAFDVAWIGRSGDRYDPPLVRRISEWVSALYKCTYN
jgi:hypothetical protein